MKKFKLRQRVLELEARVTELEESGETVTLRVHTKAHGVFTVTKPFKGWGYGKKHTFRIPELHPSFIVDEITWHVCGNISRSGSYGSLARGYYIDSSQGFVICDADFVLYPGCEY